MTSTNETYLTLNGVRHWVRQAGQLPGDGTAWPIVVLHDGPGGDVYVFEHSLGLQLESSYKIIYYEQRGCGRSDAPTDPNDYSIPILVADLEALRAALGPKRITLMGLSFGGRLAVEYALAYPEHVDGLILHAPILADRWRIAQVQLAGFLYVAEGSLKTALEQIAGRGPQAPEQLLEQIWDAVDTETIDAFLFHDLSVVPHFRRLQQASGRPHNQDMARALLARPPRQPSLLDELPRISTPVLVLCGLHDRLSGVEVCRDAVGRLPRGELGLFQDSSHFPDLEEPRSYLHVTREWIKRAVLFTDYADRQAKTLRQLQMVWPAQRLTDPPRPFLPDGYTLRAYQPGDEQGDAQGFYRLMNLAGFGDWDEWRVQSWLPRLAPDCWFRVIHQASGQIVASAMGVYDSTPEHLFGGELGWVAAHPAHAGQGLGSAVSAAVTARLLQGGYSDVHLYTEDFRLAAIRTYLKLGYMPYWSRVGAPDGGDEPQMLDRWQALCKKVGWPFTPPAWQSAWPDQAAHHYPGEWNLHSWAY